MATHNNFDSLMLNQRARVESVLSQVSYELARQGHRSTMLMVKQLSGTIPQADLTAAGHPFRKVGGRRPGPAGVRNLGGRRAQNRALNRALGIGAAMGSVPLLPINAQTNALRSSVVGLMDGRFSYVLAVGGGVRGALFVLWPEGTYKLVGRGLMGFKEFGYSKRGLIETEYRSRSKDAYVQAIQRGIRNVA